MKRGWPVVVTHQGTLQCTYAIQDENTEQVLHFI